MTPFGGLAPEAIHGLIGSGYATWVDTDARDERAVQAHGAVVVDAPLEQVYRAVTDFAAVHRHITLLAPVDVRPIDEERFDAHFEARVGLAIFALTVPLSFRFRAEPPRAVHMERYLGGAFTECAFELGFEPLGDQRTLLLQSFHGDVRSLGLVARFFLSRAPELEAAISGNMVVIPLLAMAAIAGRGERDRHGGPEGPRLEDRLKELGPALERGILTVGRLDEDGQIAEVCSAARIAAPRTRVWETVRDPSRLAAISSWIDGGRIRRSGGGEIDLELFYKASFGPLKKRYEIRVTGREDAPRRLESEYATTDGEPATYADVLEADGNETIYAHRYATDLKRDWLSRRFLGKHPELERLIAQYPPMLRVLALRRHFGKPGNRP